MKRNKSGSYHFFYKMYKIKIINGPNLNMLGLREPSIYGEENYLNIVKYIEESIKGKDVELTFFQSNHEGELVSEIQKSYYEKIDGIIINAGAYTHTSIAILDALKSVKIKAIEVHLSDIDKREEYRKKSFLKEYCFKCIKGLGKEGYIKAIDEMIKELKNNGNNS